MMKRLILLCVMVGLMDNEKNMMKAHFCRNSLHGGRKVFGQNETSSISVDWKSKGKWWRQGRQKSSVPRKMEDGKHHMTHNQQWKCRRISSKQLKKTKKHLSFTAHSVAANCFWFTCSCRLQKNLRRGKKDSTSIWKWWKIKKNLTDCKNIYVICSFLFKWFSYDLSIN